jgi:hypothetical protein
MAIIPLKLCFCDQDSDILKFIYNKKTGEFASFPSHQVRNKTTYESKLTCQIIIWLVFFKEIFIDNFNTGVHPIFIIPISL